MTRLSVVLAALALCATASATAQTPPAPPAAYQSSGASNSAQANAMMREEMFAFRREINEARLMYSQNKDMLSQLAAAQTRLYAQLTTISQQHVAKEELLRQSQAEVARLNESILQARAAMDAQSKDATTRMSALEQRLVAQEVAIKQVDALPARAPTPPPPPSIAAVADVPVSASLDRQCSNLRRGDADTWEAAVSQMLPGHVFEEVDRKNDRVWARKGSTSQGFVFTEFMSKVGCST